MGNEFSKLSPLYRAESQTARQSRGSGLIEFALCVSLVSMVAMISTSDLGLTVRQMLNDSSYEIGYAEEYIDQCVSDPASCDPCLNDPNAYGCDVGGGPWP